MFCGHRGVAWARVCQPRLPPGIRPRVPFGSQWAASGPHDGCLREWPPHPPFSVALALTVAVTVVAVTQRHVLRLGAGDGVLVLPPVVPLS